jgi:hypothetical protein
MEVERRENRQLHQEGKGRIDRLLDIRQEGEETREKWAEDSKEAGQAARLGRRGREDRQLDKREEGKEDR